MYALNFKLREEDFLVRANLALSTVSKLNELTTNVYSFTNSLISNYKISEKVYEHKFDNGVQATLFIEDKFNRLFFTIPLNESIDTNIDLTSYLNLLELTIEGHYLKGRVKSVSACMMRSNHYVVVQMKIKR